MPKKSKGGSKGGGGKPKKAPTPLPPIEVPPIEEDPEVIRAREAEQSRSKRVYAAGIKSTLDLQPTSPRLAPNKALVDTFTSPFLREQFGLVKLLDHGWPTVERGSPSPRNLPELAASTSHTSLPGTMLAPPLVPRPLSHHSSRVVPRPRPASRAERAHGRTWQQRHHSLAARSVGAFEGCARAIDSPDADTRFRRSLQALRQNRFHFAVAADPDEPSPPPTPAPLPELPEQWEAVLLAATDDWGDMAAHDALHHGRRQTERDRVREELRGAMPLLRSLYERCASSPSLAITARSGATGAAAAAAPKQRGSSSPDSMGHVELGQFWQLLRECGLETPGMTAAAFSRDFAPLTDAQLRHADASRSGRGSAAAAAAAAAAGGGAASEDGRRSGDGGSRSSFGGGGGGGGGSPRGLQLPLPRDELEREPLLLHHPLRAAPFEGFVRALLRASANTPHLAAVPLPHSRFRSMLSQHLEPSLKQPPPAPHDAAVVSLSLGYVASLAPVYSYWHDAFPALAEAAGLVQPQAEPQPPRPRPGTEVELLTPTQGGGLLRPDPSRPLPSVAEVRAQGGGFNFNELLLLLQATHLVGPELSPGDACALQCRLAGMADGGLAPHVSAANKETPIVFDAWVRFFAALAEMVLPDMASPARVEHVFSYLVVHTRLHQGRPLGDDSDLAAAADDAEPAVGTPKAESRQPQMAVLPGLTQ